MDDGPPMNKKEAIKRFGTEDLSQVLSILIEARNKVDVAEHEFLLLVEAFEVSEIWRALSSGTFEQALDLTHVCDSKRYTRWRRARAELGDNVVSEVGVSGSTQAVRIESPANRQKAIDTMRATVAKEGAVISERTARSIVARLLPFKSRVLDGAKRSAELERENAVLRRRVKELEQEVAVLRDRLRGKPPPTPKTSKNRRQARPS